MGSLYARSNLSGTLQTLSSNYPSTLGSEDNIKKEEESTRVYHISGFNVRHNVHPLEKTRTERLPQGNFF